MDIKEEIIEAQKEVSDIKQSFAMELMKERKKEKKTLFIAIIIICFFWLISSITSIFAFIKLNSQYAELNSKYLEIVKELEDYTYIETDEHTQDIQDIDTIENSYIINGGDYNG